MRKITDREKSINFLSTFFLVLLIFFSKTISADVISVNSGGNEEIVLNPDKYIEGFFSGIPGAAEEEEEEEEGGGGGGGGGGTPSVNIETDPEEFNIDIIINTNIEKTIKVTNLGRSTVTVGVTQQNLDEKVILGNTSLTISPGQSVELNVIFVAPGEPDVYTGQIIIGNVAVLVTLNVRTKLLLFDSNIVVLNENFEVQKEGTLKTIVTLIPMGDPERLDVNLEFKIKDYSGKVYLTKSETLLIEEQIKLNRNFDIGNLPLGDYIIALKLTYPNGVAPSSAHFKVIERAPVEIIGKFILFLIILILLIAITIIIILIMRKLREKKEQQSQSSQPFFQI